MKNRHVGKNFDTFLQEENILEETQAMAVKRVFAFQIRKIMLEKKITKTEMTRRMHIKNRLQIDRLMDPTNSSVTLLTLEKAANALGKRLKLQLV